MNTRDRIKEAFRKRSESIREDKITEARDAIDKFLKKSGYKLSDVIEHEGSIPELVIDPIEASYLHPEIIHDIEENVYLINVKKYGNLEASDVEEVVKGYETALGVVNYLDSVDTSALI